MTFSIFGQSDYPVRIEGLGSGEVVTLNTMEKMRQIIDESIRDYYVRRWAEVIIEGAEADDFSRVQAVYDFLNTHTNYVKDPYGVEMLKYPNVSLRLIESGETPSCDCDDFVLLSLSILKSLGFPVAMRAVSYSDDKVFSHIYGLVKVKGEGWVPFDLVAAKKGLALGEEVEGVTRIYDMEV